MNLRNNAGVYYFQKKKYLEVDNFVDEDVAKHISDQYVTLAKHGMVNLSASMLWLIVFLRWKHSPD